MASPCISLEEALKLSTEFSIHSSQGEIPDDLVIPIPSAQYCEFTTNTWNDVTDSEREAFKRFYTQVGEKLEDAASLMKQGDYLDETSWSDIVQELQV